MKFYLGTPEVQWLWGSGPRVPLFVSFTKLRKRTKLFPAWESWCLDSGGYSELALRGRWSFTEDEYAERIVRYHEDIGNIDWAAPMDWMCEPNVLRMTGLSVPEHQSRTVASVGMLRTMQQQVHVIPVLQGYETKDYFNCWQMYEDEGFDLVNEPVVGLGSVCRRHSNEAIWGLVVELRRAGLRNLHGFGLKKDAIRAVGHLLKSTDSMAWSMVARKRKIQLPDHTHVCTNCLDWAMLWRSELLEEV